MSWWCRTPRSTRTSDSSGPPRKPTAFIVRRSALGQVLSGVWSPEGSVDVFAVRDRLQQTVRFV
ncbi:hypothetical protein [Curtobacterium sp. MCJR17_043]|uniref:hypothetical protein n=1 Tax=Curtobacterium sp. MCJR17_043 TaxID=2175660 RepID=UPI0024DFDE76|nr:hypothetical protein [Curtobacterium sp. MCJR17_043]WIB34724.1 hypothetical protein DEJ15_08770 [Curtobacterium sp. MCJR17_043]